jgi:hypothetical protein
MAKSPPYFCHRRMVNGSWPQLRLGAWGAV